MPDAAARIRAVLDGYAKFLQEKDLALPKHRPYLVRWVREFLLFAQGHAGYAFEQTLDMFLADIGKRGDVKPWQIQQAGDAAGTMRPARTLKAGQSTYVRQDMRWGDYSATCVDPVDDKTFWTIQEYAATSQPSDMDNPGRWGTWWGKTTGNCPGELDGNGQVDLTDLGILLQDFGCQPPDDCIADLDGDGDTDENDEDILLENLYPTCPSP